VALIIRHDELYYQHTDLRKNREICMKTIGLTNEQALINMVDLACHLDQLIPVKFGDLDFL
jgi:hypothetical protein